MRRTKEQMLNSYFTFFRLKQLVRAAVWTAYRQCLEEGMPFAMEFADIECTKKSVHLYAHVANSTKKYESATSKLKGK